MLYVDGYVLCVPENNMADYEKIVATTGSVWMEYGALSYVESVLEDPVAEDMVSFPQLTQPKAGEKVVLSFITFRDRAHRDEVNKKVMADQRLKDICGNSDVFDWHRMTYGGFQSLAAF